MKHLAFLLSLSFLLAACQNNPSPKTGDELEKMRAALEAKKKELSDKQQIAEIEKELEEVENQIKQVEKSGGGTGQMTSTAPVSAPSTPAPQTSSTTAASSPKSHIAGSNVTMRKDASVQSDKLGSFNMNEEVTVLETKNVNNENEAILTKPIHLYVSENNSGEVAMTLPKGKAVVIEKYNSDNNKYEVSYQVPNKGKLVANISADAVETISYSTWYRVKRANGETGWVLGKFLKTN